MSKYPQEIQILYQDYPEIPYISPDRPLEDWHSLSGKQTQYDSNCRRPLTGRHYPTLAD